MTGINCYDTILDAAKTVLDSCKAIHFRYKEKVTKTFVYRGGGYIICRIPRSMEAEKAKRA